MLHGFLRSLFVVIAASFAMPVLAADDPASSGIEEIVVRARRRAELLEDSPVSVTALGSERLRVTQTQNLEDMASLVPNLTILSGRSNQDASIVIRGVGAFPFVYFDQGVGTYIDGVYISRQQGALLDIVDFQQIEVLRGPQGTLFGKNNVGGAINITTVQPKDEFEGFISVRAGTYTQVDTKATLNIPIEYGWFEDKMAMRFSIANFYNEGYTFNMETGRRHSDRNSLNFLGSARIAFTDDISFTLTGNWSREQNRGLGGECVVIQEEGFQTVGIPGGIPEGFFDACRASRKFRFRADTDGFANSVNYGVWGVFRWDLGERWLFDDVNLKYTGAWREQETGVQDDAEMTEFPLFRLSQRGGGGLADGEPQEAQQIQQEIQASFEALDGRLSVVSGAFAFWETGSTRTGIRFATGNALIDTIGTTNNNNDFANWDWALFGQAVLDVTDWLSLTGGVRYTQEKKGLNRSITNACVGDTSGLCSSDMPVDDPTIIPFTTSRETFDAWTPSGTVALKATDGLLDTLVVFDHLMGYFTYARGFRGGGFNGGARTESAESLTAFEPEFIDSYELGVKTALFDRRLTMNAAIFQADRDDQQVPQIVTAEDCGEVVCPTDVFTRNAAKTRSRGVELELVANPIPSIVARGSVGYVDAEFLDYPEAQDNLTGEPINRAGQRFSFLPEFQSNLGIQHTLELPHIGPEWAVGVLASRVDWSYESEVTNFAPELTQLTQRGYNKVDLRFGYRFNDGASEFAVWSKNVTDERYFKNTLSWARLTGTGIRYYEPPRTIGVEINHNF